MAPEPASATGSVLGFSPIMAVATVNFLAHLLLSDPTPDAYLGSVLPDLMRGRAPAGLSQVTRDHMALHLKIDRFTDEHPVFARSANRLSPPWRRYAGVLIDVFYDHVLATTWDRYAPEPLEAFAAGVYTAFSRVTVVLPSPAADRLAGMKSGDWLLRYRTTEGIQYALERLTARSRHNLQFAGAVGDLVAHQAGFAVDFAEFFPQLQAYVRRQKELQHAAEAKPTE